MEATHKLVEAIASLLWPLIVLFLIVLFRPAVSAIIESAKSRKFTLKIGGQELTMEEANQYQQNFIADLQAQVTEIRRKLESQDQGAETATSFTPEPSAKGISKVLWVDDNPKNNSYFIEQLSRAGTAVDLAMSTSDGAVRFNSRKYDFVLSDMGRAEGGTYNSNAGIDLLKLVREKNASIPFVIFCSSRARREYGEMAVQLGATLVTSSPTELAGILNLAVAQNHS